jgi:hypothetical protein
MPRVADWTHSNWDTPKGTLDVATGPGNVWLGPDVEAVFYRTCVRVTVNEGHNGLTLRQPRHLRLSASATTSGCIWPQVSK